MTVSQDELAVTPGLDPDWVNILLAGSDSRTGKGYSRTDAMIILSLNVRSGQVRMTSVMRDIWTPMHGRAPQKINACTVFGGPTLAMRTLNEDFRMNIEDYVLIDKQAIEEVIDLIGGVELEITDEALHAIARKTIERKTGARGLRCVMESILMPIMYKVPSDATIIRVTVDEDTVEGGEAHLEYGAVRKRYKNQVALS